jgi:toxin ParE1/3/4
LKPAVVRPLALRDQQGEVRHCREQGGTRVAVKEVKATNAALDQVELDPGTGSPTLGKRLGIPGLRTWRVTRFPLPWCYFECGDRLDVVRLLGERQDLAAILGDEFTANRRRTDRLDAGPAVNDRSSAFGSSGWSAGPDPNRTSGCRD